MIYAYVERIDVTENLENFLVFGANSGLHRGESGNKDRFAFAKCVHRESSGGNPVSRAEPAARDRRSRVARPPLRHEPAALRLADRSRAVVWCSSAVGRLDGQPCPCGLMMSRRTRAGLTWLGPAALDHPPHFPSPYRNDFSRTVAVC